MPQDVAGADASDAPGCYRRPWTRALSASAAAPRAQPTRSCSRTKMLKGAASGRQTDATPIITWSSNRAAASARSPATTTTSGSVKAAAMAMRRPMRRA